MDYNTHPYIVVWFLSLVVQLSLKVIVMMEMRGLSLFKKNISAEKSTEGYTEE
jgi:hypothetical protein